MNVQDRQTLSDVLTREFRNISKLPGIKPNVRLKMSNFNSLPISYCDVSYDSNSYCGKKIVFVSLIHQPNISATQDSTTKLRHAGLQYTQHIHHHHHHHHKTYRAPLTGAQRRRTIVQ